MSSLGRLEHSETARTRKSRGKYGARSCLQCRTRKVKCAGGFPCRRCVVRSQDCDFAERMIAPDATNSKTQTTSQHTRESGAKITSAQLLQRFTQLSGSMNALLQDAAQVLGPHVDRPGTLGSHSSNYVTDALPDEPSITHGYSHPSPGQSCWTWLEQHLISAGVAANQDDWKVYLQTYLDEMHPFFPFLHPPSVWQSFDDLWAGRLPALLDRPCHKDHKTSLGILFLCMALGRCTISPRSSHTEDRHSSGWTLYNIAAYSLHDLADLTRVPQKVRLLEIQALLLMSLYFFRLNVNDRAQAFLSQANTRANVFGSRREHKIEAISLFESELSIRTRHCLYLLDRLLSLETGLPYVVQNARAAPREPYCVPDSFLEASRQSSKTSGQMQSSIEMESTTLSAMSIQHLKVSTELAKMSTEIWNDHSETPFDGPNVPSHQDCTSWEERIEGILENLPAELCLDPDTTIERQVDKMCWSQMKLAIGLFMQINTLKYLVYRPTRSRTMTSDNAQDDSLNTIKICGQTATAIIRVFDQIPSRYPKYVTPFIWYLSSSAIMLLSIVARNPDLRHDYSASIQSGLESLRICATKTWISGSTIRTISRLNAIAQALRCDTDDLNTQSGSINSTPDSLADSPALALSSTSLLNEALFYRAFDIIESNKDERLTILDGPHPTSMNHFPASGLSGPGTNDLRDSESTNSTIGITGQQRPHYETTNLQQGTVNFLSGSWVPDMPESLLFDPSDWIVEEFMLGDD